MWTFTQHGFFSITVSKENRRMMQIRARSKRHLQNLQLAFPDIAGRREILETPRADYRWRILMRKSDAFRLIDELGREIDYSNFKDRCHQTGADDSPLMAIWNQMFQFQERQNRPAPKPSNQRELDFNTSHDHPTNVGLSGLKDYAPDFEACTKTEGCILDEGHAFGCLTEEDLADQQVDARFPDYDPTDDMPADEPTWPEERR